jgi:hypothetical protein
MGQSTMSIMYRNSAQKIEQSDVNQLLEAIVADSRATVATVLEHAKDPRAVALPQDSRSKAVLDAVQQLPAGYRNRLLSVSSRLRTSPLPTPRRTSAPSVLSAGLQPAAAAPAPHAQLTLRVKKIVCVSDTNEIGKDEILLGGQATMLATAADGTLATPVDRGTTAPIALGKFKDGDQKALNLTLSTFKLRDAAPYPRVFNVSMLCIEKDFGDTTKLVQLLKTLESLIEKKVIEKVQDFLSGLDDKKQFGPVIALIVTLLPAAINRLIGAVGKLLGDEQFPVFAAGVAMDAPDALFAGGKTATPEAVAQFSAFGGTYKVHHEFALS